MDTSWTAFFEINIERNNYLPLIRAQSYTSIKFPKFPKEPLASQETIQILSSLEKTNEWALSKDVLLW